MQTCMCALARRFTVEMDEGVIMASSLDLKLSLNRRGSTSWSQKELPSRRRQLIDSGQEVSEITVDT